VGSDGNLWFTEWRGNKIGRITLTGQITEFPVPRANAGVEDLALASDGNIYFDEFKSPGSIGRITPAGVITEFALPTQMSQPAGVAPGIGGSTIWFCEFAAQKIGAIKVGP